MHKIEKLLSLYKDKSITIEEKRSIAVKLVDMGVLENTPTINEKETVTFVYNNKKYKNIGANKLFEILTEVVHERNEINIRLNNLVSRIRTKDDEIDRLKDIRKWLTISLIIAVIIMIKIFN